MAWLPTGEMLVTERAGRLRVVRDGRLDPEPVAGVPRVFRERGQGGLMDVLVDPDHERNGWIYLSYAKPTANDSMAATAVVRGRLQGNRLVDVQELFVADQLSTRNNHFAGRLAMDRNRYLYLTIGDRLAAPELLEEHPSQDPGHHFGTIVRLHDDGRVPADNPFVGRSDRRPEVWSWGHRNQQGLAVHPETGDLWENEHGPRGGDELNRILPGRNYGWPVVSYGINYDGSTFTADHARRGMEGPRWVWTPSIATSGLLFYTGDAFPWWKGSLFVAGLAGQQLARLTLEGDEVRSVEVLLQGALGRIRDVRQGPDGFLYLALDDTSNPPVLSPVVRLEPVAGDVQAPR